MTGLVDELAALWAALPIPGEQWHPWVPELVQLDRHVTDALRALRDDPDAGARLEALLEAAPEPADEGDDRLGAALHLLAELPRPTGHHPFLDEIGPALDAAGVLLAAVAQSPDTRARFLRPVETAAVPRP